MNYHRPFDSRSNENTEQAASLWVIRHERGLTAAEQDEFFLWLSSSPRHGEEFNRQSSNWGRLESLSAWRPAHGSRPNPDLLSPPRPAWLRSGRVLLFPCLLAAAAVIALVAYRHGASSFPATPPSVQFEQKVAAIETRTLPDGSVIELNRGAHLSVLYTPIERRVTLEQGEAHFTVSKDPARPFIVDAQGVLVRAVGTAFSVRQSSASVEVLVTEGKVQLGRPESTPYLTLLTPGNLAIISATESAPVHVSQVDATEMEDRLAWQPRMLDFTDAPLQQVINEFNRRNAPIALRITDPTLATTEVSASLRSDNIEGFIRLLHAGFGVKADRTGQIILLGR